MEYQDTLPGIDLLAEEVVQRAIGQEALFAIIIEGDN
jgi:hypothetical protein